MSIETQFAEAAERVKTLTERPTNETLLKLYALFKQATEGDVSGDKPGMFDFKAVAKYNAWEQLKGTPKEKAMGDYASLVNSLFP